MTLPGFPAERGRQNWRARLERCVWATLLASLALMFPTAAGADTPARNAPYQIDSPRGNVSLEMTPDVPMGETTRGRGVAKDKRQGQVLWSVEWFASRGKAIPLDDGQGLIRLGPWAGDRKGLSDLAVAFYRQGRELKLYRVADLVRNPKKLLLTASHYFWLEREYPLGLSPDQKRLTLFIIDGGVVQFDTASGQMLPVEDLTRIKKARKLFAQAEELRKRGDQRGAMPLYRQSLETWPNLFLERALARMR